MMCCLRRSTDYQIPNPMDGLGETLLKSDLYRALRAELHRHDFSTFVDEPPCIAQSGQGVVVTGCLTCRKKFGTMPQFLDHLTDDVLPAALDRPSTEKGCGADL
jgi:hypothetical protein